MNQKYIVLLGDGMSDRPIDSLGGKTPLEYAKTPTWDALAKQSLIGRANTTPAEKSPGSDIANLCVMGYDPVKYHTGRSPLEAASIGVPMQDTDTTFRMNFVTLSDEPDFSDKIMADYSAGEITTAEADALVKAMQERFGDSELSFFTGTSYRHILKWTCAPDGIPLTPPHDISSRKIGDYLPGNERLLSIMKESNTFLAGHPVNQKRIREGKNPANCAWFWGQGKKTVLPNFNEKYNTKAGVISAVDLIKGIARCAGMEVFPVDGITGNVHTNFVGKAERAVQAIREGYDFVYVHVEAADESGHQNDLAAKLLSIEKLDEMTRIMLDGVRALGCPLRLMILPDHATPMEVRTHVKDLIPFLIYDSEHPQNHPEALYNEAYAKTTGLLVDPGDQLMDLFFGKKSF